MPDLCAVDRHFLVRERINSECVNIILSALLAAENRSAVISYFGRIRPLRYADSKVEPPPIVSVYDPDRMLAERVERVGVGICENGLAVYLDQKMSGKTVDR